jgi:hypothetical protein
MKAVLGLAAAVALITPLQASTVMPNVVPDRGSIIMVEGGCGPYAHRDYSGFAVRTVRHRGITRPDIMTGEIQFVGSACPGWHFGGGRCWPNGCASHHRPSSSHCAGQL